ncbi:hypothetical protein Pint_19321 [Pistacia integerrima]|uniref:Uncharacterized protein n=1 Tax=Pistacia integerrima TaxID=434235 RepID=A0ACC0Z0Z5_9ROSI|nr:hypothetical protein Pint_19321 [Pistacia integerrima]
MNYCHIVRFISAYFERKERLNVYTTKQFCVSGQTRAPSLEKEIERAMLECQKGRIKTAIAIVNEAENATRSFFLVSRTDSLLKYGNKKEKGCRLKPRDDYFLYLLVEAIDFAKEKKTWNFWECCDKKFADSMSYTSHLVEKHDFNIKRDDDLKQYLPEIVDDDSVEMIMNGIWKPVDIAIATEIVQNNINVEPPLCNDRQRTELLVAIRDRFQVLLKHGFLTKSHIWWAISITLEEFRMNISVKQFRKHGLLALKVLGYSRAPQLEKILNFLMSLAGTFGMSETGKPSEINYIDNIGDEVYSVNQKVMFSEDLSCLLMEKQVLLRRKVLVRIMEKNKRVSETKSKGAVPEYRKFSYLSDLMKRNREYEYVSAYRREQKRDYEDILYHDAMIMRSVSVLNKYKQQLRNATPYDYQSITFLLLKSFMESRLEDLEKKQV